MTRVGAMNLAITPYGLASLVSFGFLYAVYLSGINPASLAGAARWFAWSSFWLHFLVLFLCAALLARGIRALTRQKPGLGQAIVGTAGALLTLWMFIDGKVFSLFQIHINRLLIEALLQQDSIGAIGASPTAQLASLWPLALCLLPHLFIRHLSTPELVVLRGRGLIVALFATATLVGADKATYAFYYFKGAPFVFELKNAAPIYPTPHPYHIRKVYGGVLGQGSQVTFMAQLGDRLGNELPPAGHFAYPRVAPHAVALERPLNIIMVVAESLRAADFNPRTAPFLSALADSSITAARHYSSSNSTHLGLFSLFYGLNPHYFHDARVGSVPSAPLRLLALSGYEIHQSLSFSMEWYDLEHFIYGQPPQTFLAAHADAVERDRAVTDHTLELARVNRDRGVPYFNFVYYYATHADHAHPPETAVFEPALKGPINFADPRLRENREALLNRYRNSIRFIDTEMERMVEGLQAAGVWDDTILLFTSDHGEEFFEEGRYGHNSSLNHYQTQVPFVLHFPGQEPRRIQRLTSHADAIGTLLAALGAPEDFLANVQGHDLFAMEEQPIYLGNAHYQRPERYAILTGETKIEIDLTRRTPRIHAVTDLEGQPVAVPDDMERAVLGLLQQFRAFQR